MQHRSATVIRLQIHLERQQRVYYQIGEEEATLERAGQSMLQRYFELNSSDPEARLLIYKQVGEKYVWNKSRHVWTRREVRIYFL